MNKVELRYLSVCYRRIACSSQALDGNRTKALLQFFLRTNTKN
jgi:hypothetical protein